MAVSIHYANVGLVWIDPNGNVIDKNDPSTKLSTFEQACLKQEHRVFPNLTGPGSTVNSQGYPTVAKYLELEAADGFAFAYMDQTQIITQMIV